MPLDVKFFQTNNDFSTNVANGSIELTDGIDTMLYMSLFAEKRALPSEVSVATQRKGHPINTFNEDGYESGSKLWLYISRNANAEANLTLIESTIIESLQWMINDKLVTRLRVEVSKNGSQVVANITIYVTESEILYRQAVINTFHGN